MYVYCLSQMEEAQAGRHWEWSVGCWWWWWGWKNQQGFPRRYDSCVTILKHLSYCGKSKCKSTNWILSRPRAERARALTVSQCPHSEVGQDFLLRRRITPTETAVNRKQKVEKWIRRCQIDRLREGYKRAIDEIRGPIAKNGFSGQNFGPKKNHFLTLTMFRPRPGNVVQRKKYRFTK